MELLISKLFCPIKYIFLYWNVGLDDIVTIAFCEPFLNHMKQQSQPHTLHLSCIYRRYYRAGPVSVRSLTIEVLFVRF